jgi:hypothetical protein
MQGRRQQKGGGAGTLQLRMRSGVVMKVEKMLDEEGRWLDWRYLIRDAEGRVVYDNIKSRKEAVDWIKRRGGDAVPC